MWLLGVRDWKFQCSDPVWNHTLSDGDNVEDSHLLNHLERGVCARWPEHRAAQFSWPLKEEGKTYFMSAVQSLVLIMLHFEGLYV